MQLASVGYPVSFEGGDFSYLKKFLSVKTYSKVFIICDRNSKKHCLPLLVKRVKALKGSSTLALPPGEENKTLAGVEKCWKFLLENGADRHSLVICVGGGVVCDMGGFAASTFKRGIDFIHIPTTLLAMADASVGGKTGVDFKGYKNLVGTITQPKGVFIDELFLRTLPERHIRNGMAEIIKAALIGDDKLWKKLLTLKDLKKANHGELIISSVKVKNKIVVADPDERGVRAVLNLGHTAGHAIESFYLDKRNSLLHGEAIVMGMCVELCLGKSIGITQAKAAAAAIRFFKEHFKLKKFSAQEQKAFLKLMQHDKKNFGRSTRFALIEKPGKALFNVEVSAKDAKEAFILYNNLLA